MSYLLRQPKAKRNKKLQIKWIIVTYIGWLIIASSILFEQIEFIILFISVGGFITAILQLIVFRGQKIKVSIRNWPILTVVGIYAGLIFIIILFVGVAISAIIGAFLGSELLGIVGTVFVPIFFTVLGYMLIGDKVWGFALSLSERMSESNIFLLESFVIIAGSTSSAILFGFLFSVLLASSHFTTPIFLSGIAFSFMSTIAIEVLIINPSPKVI